jgi:hypothetical protein
MPYDLRLDVPARAYINAQLISLLDQGGSAYDAKKQLFSAKSYAGSIPSEQVYEWKLYDHSLAISLLYCTIVVPRELLAVPADHPMYREFDAHKVPAAFRIAEPAQIDSYQLVRSLREAVALAQFSIREQDGEAHWEFWTEREPRFRASIGHNALLGFISVVGQRFTNALTARK